MRRGRRPRGESASGEHAHPDKGRYYMISVVAKAYGIHPQTLRLYEREGLLEPSRTEGNTRLYSDDDLKQLEVILNLTRDLGVNLAGVEIVLNMRRKMAQMQAEMNDFVAWVKDELQRQSREGWQERLEQALVRLPPMHIVRSPAENPPSAPPPRAAEAPPPGERGERRREG
jgi:MerR family transcriptional regulator/heat shock protein HspR